MVVIPAIFSSVEFVMGSDECNSSGICRLLNGCGSLNGQLDYLLKTVDNNRETFDNCDPVVSEFIFSLIHQLKIARERHTIFVNNMIATSVRDHVANGNWPQLCQIQRALPDDIVSALGSADCDRAKEIITSSAMLHKRFNGLSVDQKREVLASVEG